MCHEIVFLSKHPRCGHIGVRAPREPKQLPEPCMKLEQYLDEVRCPSYWEVHTAEELQAPCAASVTWKPSSKCTQCLRAQKTKRSSTSVQVKVEDDEDPEWNKRVVEEDTVYDYEDKDEDEYEDWEGTDTEADDDMSQADELEEGEPGSDVDEENVLSSFTELERTAIICLTNWRRDRLEALASRQNTPADPGPSGVLSVPKKTAMPALASTLTAKTRDPAPEPELDSIPPSPTGSMGMESPLTPLEDLPSLPELTPSPAPPGPDPTPSLSPSPAPRFDGDALRTPVSSPELAPAPELISTPRAVARPSTVPVRTPPMASLAWGSAQPAQSEPVRAPRPLVPITITALESLSARSTPAPTDRLGSGTPRPGPSGPTANMNRARQMHQHAPAPASAARVRPAFPSAPPPQVPTELPLPVFSMTEAEQDRFMSHMVPFTPLMDIPWSAQPNRFLDVPPAYIPPRQAPMQGVARAHGMSRPTHVQQRQVSHSQNPLAETSARQQQFIQQRQANRQQRAPAARPPQQSGQQRRVRQSREARQLDTQQQMAQQEAAQRQAAQRQTAQLEVARRQAAELETAQQQIAQMRARQLQATQRQGAQQESHQQQNQRYHYAQFTQWRARPQQRNTSMLDPGPPPPYSLQPTWRVMSYYEQLTIPEAHDGVDPAHGQRASRST